MVGCDRVLDSSAHDVHQIKFVTIAEPSFHLRCASGDPQPQVFVYGVGMEHVEGVAAVIRLVGFDQAFPAQYINLCQPTHYVTP